MNLFEPDGLSPLPIQPQTCELPYGLTWDDLQSVLPDFDVQESSKARAYVSHEKQGLSGGANSQILKLSYPIPGNQTAEQTIFFKINPDPDKAEAPKYRFIESRGVATPRLLAAYQKGAAEVVLLEFLPEIGIDFQSASEVDELLHLAAALNAIQDPPGLFDSQPGLPQAEFDASVREALVVLAQGRSLPKIDASRWYAAYLVAQEASKSMPQAVNHNEFYFQQVGWAPRGPDRRLVLFDLETMALTPRFTDIGGILYPLSSYTGRDQAGLFQVYLDHLRRLGHFDLDFTEALRELKLLRVAASCYSLPWLVAESKDSTALDRHESLALTLACLQDDLTVLGFL